MTPPTDFNAVRAMRAELTQLLGGKAQMLSYMVKNGASHMKDQFRIFGAELARRGSSLTSAAPATAKPAAVPARQLIRLGATTPPSTPAATPPAPKPPTHQFVPAPKPTPPPAKGGARSGALSIDEAEALAGQVFKDYAPSPSVTEAARWASLEGVFKANGHNAPWLDAQSIAIPWPKLVGHASRTRKIAQVFQTGLTRSEFGKMSAFDQSNFCKSGGQLRD